MDSGSTIEVLRDAALALRSHAQPTVCLRAIQSAQDALDAAKASQLAALEEFRGYEDDGASSVKTWVRNNLRLDPGETNTLVAAGSTLRDLPLVADAAGRGEIRLAHVKSLTYGIRHIGRDIMVDSQAWLVDVAKTHEPAELHQVVRALREAVFPDSLDKAWADGMAKQDIKITPVPEGWHLTGFLDTDTGAKLDAVLRSSSAPRGADDERPVAQRRVEAFDELLTSVIEHGLPVDRGIRPHLSVLVEADTLRQSLSPTLSDLAVQPAHLVGFGAIGPQLLGYLTCGADLTPILLDGETAGPDPQANVLDVGRSQRYATMKQRRAISARQGGECAAPGCTNPLVHLHHVRWYAEGGPTDLANLAGLCPACHQLIHRKLLNVEADGHGGFSFTNRHHRPIRREHRSRFERHRQTRRLVGQLAHRQSVAPLRT